ncbi:Ent-kaurenoic acid oxidase 1 [Heracleum sosnowskyi]|uniref:Ent-kaurenoic acid oxidase 1 n=1 Tax=Heracleum sosnowskyi TaxID=360622 RepID=A0AAD8M5Z2_9APIA|nr:Ent-kaurenoic acid oxidase 1 [Heracleum sosnowskyi]
MEFISMVTSIWVVTWVLGILPLMGCYLWWSNDLWCSLRLKLINGRREANAKTGNSMIKLPPGHMGLPYVGELLSFLWYFKIVGRPDDYINSKRHRYGDGIGLYRTHLFGSPGVIACKPAVIKFIMQTESDFKIDWPSVELVGASSLVAVHGTSHTRLRSFVSRAINLPQSLRHIAIMVQPRIIAALQSWSNQGTIGAHLEAKKVTFENIGSFFASLEPGPVLDTLDKLFTGILRGFRASPINFPGSAYRHALQCREKATMIFRKELEKKRKKIRDGVDVRVNNVTNDLMDGLMGLKDDEGKELSDTEVLDNIVSLVIAGYESTSLAIMWALYYLAKYPSVLQKLREENMCLRKHKNEEQITSDDIAKLNYTNKVVEETIRMANIAAFIFRTATKDVEYKGYTIPRGWKVMMWVRYLHTNPENFDDPMSFNPDRWNEPAKAGTYQVFGGGSRICAGNMLARLQVAIFLHHLAIGYKWELVNPKAKMTYLPHPKPEDGVMISFRKL